jgi:hypothetical protein
MHFVMLQGGIWQKGQDAIHWPQDQEQAFKAPAKGQDFHD